MITVICPNEHEVESSAKFCRLCGSPVTILVQCRNGHEVEPDNRFCAECGDSLSEPGEPVPHMPVSNTSKSENFNTTHATARQPVASARPRRRAVAAAAIGVAIAVGGTAAGFSLFGRFGQTPAGAAYYNDAVNIIEPQEQEAEDYLATYQPEEAPDQPENVDPPVVNVPDTRSDLERALDHFIATGDNAGVLTYSEGNRYQEWRIYYAWYGDGIINFSWGAEPVSGMAPLPLGEIWDWAPDGNQYIVPFREVVDWEWLPAATCEDSSTWPIGEHWDMAIQDMRETDDYFTEYRCHVARAFGLWEDPFGDAPPSAPEWFDVYWTMNANPDETWTRTEWFS